MIGRLFKRHRQLKNGEDEIIRVISQPEQDMHPDWVLDTYRIAYGLSKGDRSVPIAALGESQPTGFFTSEGSATQDLWSRMVFFGYGTTCKVKASPGARLFEPHKSMLPRIVQFLAASKVEGTTEETLKPLSRAFSKRQNVWMGLPDQVLLQLRFSFDRAGASITAPELEKNELFAEFLGLGLLEKPDGRNWPVTSLGMTTMPFLIDFLLEKKGFDWENQNDS